MPPDITRHVSEEAERIAREVPLKTAEWSGSMRIQAGKQGN